MTTGELRVLTGAELDEVSGAAEVRREHPAPMVSALREPSGPSYGPGNLFYNSVSAVAGAKSA